MIALVPTCNRPKLFKRLVSRLDGFKVFGFVNNTFDENLYRYEELKLPDNVRLLFTNIYGEPKACHVQTFRYMLNFVNSECLVIEDDVYPCENFKEELNKRIAVLKAYTPKNFTLSPIHLPNRNSDRYTGLHSRSFSTGGFDFINQAWVDGNFYMTADVCRAMKKWLSGNVKIFGASSGIGRRNSQEIAKREWKMFTAVPTLVEHLDHESVMFGERRQQVPLIARFENS